MRRTLKWLIALVVGVGIQSTAHESMLLAQESDDLVMIVNKGNAATMGMNLGEARKLLLGEISGWRTGAKVIVVLKPAGSADRAAILKKVCGMTEAAFTKYELQASFTGQNAATVHEAASAAMIKGMVKANPGAVGFLHKSELDDTVKSVLELP